MPGSDPAAFHGHFASPDDPRVERTRKHPLINVLVIAVCGVLSGANSFAGICECGSDRRSWFSRYLDLTNGIPSDDTFARVLARIDPAAFQKCLLGWIQAVQEVSAHRPIAIDGKALRGSYNRGDAQAAIHMVSAWAVENKLSLGQVVVDAKSNEITAIPELLGLREISGAVVTIDAMECQKEIAELIREGAGITCWRSRRTSRRCPSGSGRRSARGWSRRPGSWGDIRPSRRGKAGRRRGPM
jgi:hypothetical protein